MPGRYLRDGIVRSRRFNDMPMQVQLFFYKLISLVDDYGRFEADAEMLSSVCYPLGPRFRATEVARWLECLSAAGCVHLYEAGGARYLQIERFGQRTRSASKYPPPYGDLCADPVRPSVPSQAEQGVGAARQGLLNINTTTLSDTCQTDVGQVSAYNEYEDDNVIRVLGPPPDGPPVNNSEPAQPVVAGRLLAPAAEEELLAQIAQCFGIREAVANGGMWRTRMRAGRESLAAVRNAIEDYRVRTPEQRAAIKNRGAWATDRYERGLAKLVAARKAAKKA